jgi:hypothetical protein
LNGAVTKGGEIAAQAQKALGSKLKRELGKGGPEQAIRFCQQGVHPLIDSLNRLYQAKIRRVTFKARNPADKPRPLESQILREYEEAFKRSDELKDQVHEIDDHTVLFTRPIIIEKAVCLKCHGVPGKDIEEGTLKTLKSLYPDDQATGYSMKDFRGMWSIRLPESTLSGSASAK